MTQGTELCVMFRPLRYSSFLLLLFLYRRIVEGVVEASRFLAFLGLAHDEVSDVDDVAQLAYLARCLGAKLSEICNPNINICF